MLKPHYNCLAIVIMKGNFMFSARNKNIKNISIVLGHNMFSLRNQKIFLNFLPNSTLSRTLTGVLENKAISQFFINTS